MTFEWGDMKFFMKLTRAAENPFSNSITVNAVPYEDSILPVALQFEPPLIEYSTNADAFRYQWQKLTYAFDLPDPASFPQFAVEEPDSDVLTRFVEVGRRLAGYSAINGGGGLAFSSQGHGEWSVTAEHPSDEAFAGTSVFFRQLHNGGDEASYDKVKGILFKSARSLPREDFDRFKDLMSSWDDARKALMNKMLATLICEKAAPPGSPADFPFSYSGINPSELILTYNYGDNLHWGSTRDRFVELTADPTHADYYKHSCLSAIIVLSHFYFGVADIIERVRISNQDAVPA
ncbi:hypothetical protein HQ346_16520 [Rhodococcus sp. BP-252]|uniref:hypothetical protein n=1 Tax=unclassified Rhodococcus (in: high G+C Gram-positive bacteria) TaxID=192944 RepID=UPI001C9BB5C0|nr:MULTISPECIES: hypothetical protein [unclassified Rhodococcus (in: high G+C Gram-positive bacteria)]MBY6413304.1 hypothetical protein [Rhodococcus sp. BP-320]MBY6418092.1 hypothetical protein [Rhodococcus sp. BP-321]MBY6422218.1 hypothetical protein [Rhodococcus sp. BP-324]MBY6428141.1 hypothetical protein [Rhodococcus sp. BP-323]MBY6433225.1 hypothetical protein [Rhodococcus sp. BP-322]